MKWLTRFTAVSVTAALTLVAGELAVRWLDGFVLFSVVLRDARPLAAPSASITSQVSSYFASIKVADGVNPTWYNSDPLPVPKHPDNALIRERLLRYPTDPIGAILAWNPFYLRRELCAGHSAGSLGILQEFYVFEPAEDSPYPIFRHLPSASPPGSFTSDRFGWRGPELEVEKGPGTIRIAFVGASTTVSAHYYAYSHPELIGHWLNLWARERALPYRFEVINAGRTGIDSSSIEAIVRQEVVPVEPDLVIYYEGANQFAPGRLMLVPERLASKPAVTFRKRSPLEDYLASARRALTALDIISGGNGYEPRKPGYPIVWPRDVDQDHPDVTHKPLPMGLEAVVADLDRMRTALADVGAEFAVSSFLWMVYPGMRLDLSRDLGLYRFLNDTYWPATYAHLRRTADFQNRLFASYAERYGLPFFDIAAVFPKDPALFGDPVHLLPPGLRLQGWIYFQQLVPLIRDRLQSGRWPRARVAMAGRAQSPYTPSLMSRQNILASCPQ